MSHPRASFIPLTGPDFGRFSTLPERKPYTLLHKEPEAQWDENALQQELFHWMRYHYPTEELSFFAIPNGGLRSKKTANDLMLTGTKPGYPDTGLDLPRQGFHGLRMELKKLGGTFEHQGKLVKNPRGVLKPNQREWLARLQTNGYRAEAVWGLQAAIDIITDYLG